MKSGVGVNVLKATLMTSADPEDIVNLIYSNFSVFGW